MNYSKYITLILAVILAFLTLNIQAQDITGTWVGTSDQSYLKLVVIHKGDSVYGYTYDEGPGFCKATFAGKYDTSSVMLKGQGMDMLKNSGSHGLAVYRLNYSKDESGEYLRGPIAMKSKLARMLSFGMTGFVRLKKFKPEVDTIPYMRDQLVRLNKPVIINPQIVQPVSDSLKIQEKVPTLPIAKEIPDVKKRMNKVVQTIYTDADSLKMLVYDNGTVDDDTVTILVDGVVIVNQFRISGVAKEIKLPLFSTGLKHSILLYANNLGTIPPNTALIIIHAGTKRYELRASYDLQTNAEIIIRRNENDR